ncbi:MAG: AAA family ATPase [Candidatus Wallbacteria bacterium]|nr:AAA family ATPase [Candidatus Wallbacteria bacterium]
MDMIVTTAKGFYGRDQELTELLAALPIAKVMVIAGLGGIGKSALARAFAASVSENDPGLKVLYLTCRNGESGLDLFSELAEMTGERGRDKAKSLDFPLETATLLETKSLALFLDDFQQIENDAALELIRQCSRILLRGRLVVITRKRLEFSSIESPGLFQLKLDGLNDHDSFSLIDQLLSFHHFSLLGDVQKKKIFERSGGHPLSIKLLVSLLISGRFSLEALLDGEDFLTELSCSLLSRVWENLDKETRLAGGKLALLQIPVKPGDMPGAEKALDNLSAHFLLEHDPAGRVYLHDLLKDYIAGTIDEKQKKKIRIGIAEYFVGKKFAEISELKEAFNQYHKAGETELAVDILLRLCEELRLLGAEAENILNLISSFLESGKYRQQDLCKSRVELLIYHKKFGEAEQALAAVKDPLVFRYLSAILLSQCGEHREAMTEMENLIPELPGGRDKAEILLTLADNSITLGDFSKAEDCYQQLKSSGNWISPLFQARIEDTYGVFLARRGRLNEAVTLASSAEKIYRSYKAQFLISEALYNQVNYLVDLQELEDAWKKLELTVEICSELRDYHSLAFCQNIKGEILFLRGEFQEAVRAKQDGLNYAAKGPLSVIRGMLHNSLGQIYVHLGDFEQAEGHFRTSFTLFSKDEEPGRTIWGRQNYAQFLLLCGRIEEATEELKMVAEFAESTGQPRLLAALYYFRSLLNGIRGDENGRGNDFRLFQENLALLPNKTREKLIREFDWYANRLGPDPGEQLLTLITSEGKRKAQIREIARLRSSPQEFEFFADFSSRELYIDGKEAAFFRRKVLAPLLQIFAAEPGKILKPQTIFPFIWKREYDAENDGSTFRMTITRLRAALYKADPERFIRFSPEAGGYFFNNRCRYCIILPEARGV